MWLRKLDCIAPSAEGAIAVHAVRPPGLDAFLDELPPDAAAYIRATGFAGQSGRVALIPGRRGVAGALLGLGADSGPNPFGALPFALPEGSTARFAGPLDSPVDAVLGYCMGAYRFSQLLSSAGRPPALLALPQGTEPALDVAETLWLARDLINLPANVLGPAELAQAAAETLIPLGATVDVIEGEALEAGYPLVAAVGRSAERPPRVVVARWSAPGAGPDAKLISLCGKGVVFDAGGLDLKSSIGMLRMKKDMGGAAIALAIARLVCARALPCRLELRLACVENSVSDRSFRPMDVLRSRRGLTVQIGNTDAEGRLLLADLLADACEASPSLLLDFATLTGAARVALGHDLPALFCNDDALAEMFVTEARRAHDSVWRMPLYDGYNSMLETFGADLSNVSEKPVGGAIIAALFLQRFVAPGVRWGHVDVYAWNDAPRAGRPEGGSAQGVRAGLAAISRFIHIAD
jgi:leucyl aminopeptidase